MPKIMIEVPNNCKHCQHYQQSIMPGSKDIRISECKLFHVGWNDDSYERCPDCKQAEVKDE